MICCDHCGRKIEENEPFYDIDDETFYCDNCVEERTFIYYTIDGETIFDENNAGGAESLEEYRENLRTSIKNLKRSIKSRKKDLKETAREATRDVIEFSIEHEENTLKKLEKVLELSLTKNGEEEG